MRNISGQIRVASFLLCAFALLSVNRNGLRAQSQQPPHPDPQFPDLIHSTSGPDLFRAYCAPCHGTDAKGHGPLSPAFKTTVPDLTAMAKRNGGQFPTARVRKSITGEELATYHGPREMPVWGPIFHQVEADVDWGNERVENLVKYLQSIQSNATPATAAPAEPLSGADLYHQHCASCHGADLKGTTPAPPAPYRMPPDLTTLSKRHGGKYPEAYVSKVLRSGVVMPAHGPAQMPIWGMEFKASDITKLTEYMKSQQAK